MIMVTIVIITMIVRMMGKREGEGAGKRRRTALVWG